MSIPWTQIRNMRPGDHTFTNILVTSRMVFILYKTKTVSSNFQNKSNILEPSRG